MLSTIIGSEGILDIVVTGDMTATLEERTLHPVYSTFWLGYHAEVASRRAIERHFAPGDDAVGSALSLRHRAMAPIGAAVRITARVTAVDGNRVTCSVDVRWGDTLLASGEQEQVVLPADVIARKVAEAYNKNPSEAR